MQAWKRRVVLLAAIGIGAAGFLMPAGAQTTPPSIPGFTLPSFGFPSIPDFPAPTIGPPPTMPPLTSPPTIGPPPTMPPLTSPPSIPPPPTMPPPTSPPSIPPPPTMPPFSVPSIPPPPTIPPPTIPPSNVSSGLDAQINSLIDELAQFGDRFEEAIDLLRDLQDSL